MAFNKPLLTVSEVHKDLRKCGVNWSEVVLRIMIKEGRFPGTVAHKRFYVFSKEYEEYKRVHGFEYIDKPAPTDDKYTKAVMEFENAMKAV